MEADGTFLILAANGEPIAVTPVNAHVMREACAALEFAQTKLTAGTKNSTRLANLQGLFTDWTNALIHREAGVTPTVSPIRQETE